MHGWQIFWTLWLLLSSVAFALITIVVSIKGFGDVRRMLRGIQSQKHETHE